MFNEDETVRRFDTVSQQAPSLSHLALKKRSR
jgi:hypothetical protein